jgi:hypothetical protein
MQPIEADALERESKLGDRVRIIAADPGRPSRQFGSGLVNRILKEDLAAAELWKPGQLSSVGYSDRYLKAPLPVVLMMQTMTALRKALAPGSEGIPLSIITEPLRSDPYGSAPRFVWSNWSNDDDRAEVVIALAELCGFVIR